LPQKFNTLTNKFNASFENAYLAIAKKEMKIDSVFSFFMLRPKLMLEKM
jgi:hypothetical protein